MKNDGSIKNKELGGNGQDFKVTIDGSTYWLELGTPRVEFGKQPREIEKQPTETFFMHKEKLYYKEKSGIVRNVGNVNKSQQGQKKEDFINALQELGKQD